MILARQVFASLLAAAIAAVLLHSADAPRQRTAEAATINVPCNTNDLINAIIFANNEVGNPGPDTLELAAGCMYELTTVYDGDTGLPAIRSIITINGNGATVMRSGSATDHFRILRVAQEGALTLNDATITGGDLAIPVGLPHGGGIMAFGPLEIRNSTIIGNRAGDGKNNASSNGGNGGNGGGIYFSAAGALTITGSTISNNSAGNGGSGGPGFSDGFGGQAGGIYLTGPSSFATKVIGNTTITGNSAGSGVAGQAQAGGIQIALNGVQIVNTTVSGNNASSGGGILSLVFVMSKNSLVADNAVGNCSGVGFLAGSTNNMASDNTCGATFTQKTLGEINLGPLADNGGLTQTMALMSPSASIDAGDNPTCDAAPVNQRDQRGAFRPQDGDGTGGAACDVGAYEYCPAASDCDGDGFTDVIEAGAPLCANAVNDDAPDDAVVDDGCPGGPAQAGAFSEAQFNIGTGSLYPCGNDSWPADLWDQPPLSANKITVQDLTSFIAPVRRLSTSPGDANFSSRWDLVPGKGIFSNTINVQDMTALVTLAPPMLNGARALNGPVCPLPSQ